MTSQSIVKMLRRRGPKHWLNASLQIEPHPGHTVQRLAFRGMDRSYLQIQHQILDRADP